MELNIQKMTDQELANLHEKSRDIREFRAIEAEQQRRAEVAKANAEQARIQQWQDDADRKAKAAQFESQCVFVMGTYQDYGLTESEIAEAQQLAAEAGKLGDIDFASSLSIAIINARPVKPVATNSIITRATSDPTEETKIFEWLAKEGWELNSSNVDCALQCIREGETPGGKYSYNGKIDYPKAK